MIGAGDVARLDLGYFDAPESHYLAGQKIVVVGYLIRHPEALVLVDTGIGRGNAEAEAMYRPVRRPLPDALAGAGVSVEDVARVINCHLHFDHSGENHLFPKRPIFAQRTEYADAHTEDYTMPVVYDFPGAEFELLDGEAEVMPGIRIVPTPGHTPGHQSVVVETKQGRIVIAGQAFNLASDFAARRFAWELAGSGADAPPYPDWVARLGELDPWRVVFAHDLAVWER